MMIERIESATAPEARYVDVITSHADGTVVGYTVHGCRPGPNILVAGFNPTAGLIYDSLLNLPTLPWLHGSLSLIMLNTLDTADLLEPLLHRPVEQIDEILFLPFTCAAHEDAQAVSDGYWTVLRLCARLGMIDGRGVFRNN